MTVSLSVELIEDEEQVPEEQVELIESKEIIKEEAAVKIQAMFRGYKVCIYKLHQ